MTAIRPLYLKNIAGVAAKTEKSLFFLLTKTKECGLDVSRQADGAWRDPNGETDPVSLETLTH